MKLVSAGHHPPLLVDANRARYLELAPGSPLGVLGKEPEPWSGKLAPGQALLLYTDGALNERRVGSERAMAGLATAVGSQWYGRLDVSALCDRVVGRLSADRVDDVALLALQLTGS
jgi:serine phosphatase RsbU (regulator of sigma subunit)